MEFTIYYDYLRLVRDGKPINHLISLMLDRVPAYLNNFDYRPDLPNKMIQFIEGAMYTQKGANTDNFKLQLEQKFLLHMVFGFYKPGTKKRVIKELPLIIGAGSGKSTFTAGIALARMIIGSERGADILVLANTKEQAQETFGTASAIVRDDRSSVMSMLYKKQMLQPIINKIKYNPTNSSISIKALDDKSADGVNVAVTIFDEIHAYNSKDGAVIANIKKSASTKRPDDFLQIFISTNGVVRGETFDKLYKRWVSVLNGEIDDFSTFPMIFKLDDISEVTDPDTYEKALPFIKTIGDPLEVYNMVLQAKGDPTAQAQIISKTFNIPQNAFNALFTTKELNEASKELPVTLESNRVLVGIDMGETDDLTSASFVTRVIDADGSYKYHVRALSFIPRNTFETHTNKELYRSFEQKGELVVLDGAIIDHQAVYNAIDDYLHDNNLEVLYFGYDNWNIRQLLDLINTNYGDYYTHRVAQNARELSGPLKMLKSEIKAGNVWIEGDLLKWSLNNLRVKVDANGNIFPNKQKSADKIDSVVASLDALWLLNNIEDINSEVNNY